MIIVWLLAALTLASAPSAAAEIYIAQNVTTKECTIVDSPPTTTELVLVANGSVYFERNEAERVLRSLADCTSPNAKAVSSADTNAKAVSSADTRPKQAQARRTVKPKVIATKKPPAVTTASSQAIVQRDPTFSFFSLFR